MTTTTNTRMPPSAVRTFVVVPAAGSGARLGADIPKQYLPLAGHTILEHTLDTLLSLNHVQRIVVAVAAEDLRWKKLAVAQHSRVVTVIGGKERCHSVLNALDSLSGEAADSDWVLVHDVARPCVKVSDIERMRTTFDAHPVGCVLGVPVSDTIKRADAGGMIETTVDRQLLWRAQTPQMARYGLLRAALRSAIDNGVLPTDEAAALELAGHMPVMCAGSDDNIKITQHSDLLLAEMLIREQQATRSGGSCRESHMANLHIGQGVDVHAFGAGNHVVLGGVRIPHTHGLVAHSDGDVLIHALCDALLGAVGKGDIGKHFPDNDAQWKNADSRDLLRHVMTLLIHDGWCVSNADVTVIAQAPRLSTHTDAMCANLAADMQVPIGNVNVKATTTEHLGFIGRGEGIAAQAVVMVARRASAADV